MKKFSVILDTTEISEIQDYLKENNISYENVGKQANQMSYDEIKYYASSRKKLEILINLFWDDPNFFEDIKSVPESDISEKKIYEICADQGNVHFEKVCQDKSEAKIISEYYEKSGFYPENIRIKTLIKGSVEDDSTWEEWGFNEISGGQIIGEIQCMFDCVTEAGAFGDGVGCVTNIMPTDKNKKDLLKIVFGTGDEFILELTKLPHLKPIVPGENYFIAE